MRQRAAEAPLEPSDKGFAPSGRPVRSAARITSSNRHPLVPYSTLEAGFRLMLDGLAIEMPHGFLMRLKPRRPK